MIDSANLPPRVTVLGACMQIPPRPSEEHVKILVVGERGVGKTTLLQNLLVSYGGARVFQQVCMPLRSCCPLVTLTTSVLHRFRSQWPTDQRTAGHCQWACTSRHAAGTACMRALGRCAAHACGNTSRCCLSLQAPEAATTLANFRAAPASLATRVPVALSATATLVYTVQEAPGYAKQHSRQADKRIVFAMPPDTRRPPPELVRSPPGPDDWVS